MSDWLIFWLALGMLFVGFALGFIALTWIMYSAPPPVDD